MLTTLTRLTHGLTLAALLLNLAGCPATQNFDAPEGDPRVAEPGEEDRDVAPRRDSQAGGDQNFDGDEDNAGNGNDGGNRNGDGDDRGNGDGRDDLPSDAPPADGGFPADEPPVSPENPGSGGGADPTIPTVPGTPRVDDAARIAEATRRLADRFFETSSSSGSSDNTNFVSGVDQMQLCAFGRFGRLEKTFFSGSTPTDFIDASDEDVFLGTWSIRIIQGFVVLELNIDQSSEQISDPIRQILVEFTPDGQVAFDGRIASEEDAAADCAAAEQAGG